MRFSFYSWAFSFRGVGRKFASISLVIYKKILDKETEKVASDVITPYEGPSSHAHEKSLIYTASAHTSKKDDQ